MIKAIIIDDEPKVRHGLSLMLKQQCPDVMIVAEADGVQSGYEAIVNSQPDLIFLDICMDDGSGFDLLEKFASITFRIIFVTAYEEYAVKAFRFSAIDYLLKPLDAADLAAAVDRVRRMLLSEQEQRISNLLLNMKDPRKEEKKIVLRTQEKFHFVKVGEIVYCESDGNYTTFYLESGQHILVSKSLKEYDELLSEYGFYRPHKSYIINLSCVTGFEKGEGGFIIMKDDIRIPVSYRKKEEFLKMVEGM